MKKALVIMAAGMGSRYGGLKQIDSVGPNGEIIIDYSIYDAKLAGFSKVYFIIKRENYDIFREVIGDRIASQIETEYVFQELTNIPEGYKVPEERVKPWGTAHAIMSCLGKVKEPFLVINADDFYGRDAFVKVSEWIDKADLNADPMQYCMAGYILKNTLTEYGHVARGVCTMDENNYLTSIVERTKIMRRDGQVQYTEEEENWVDLDENSIVSMNCWCLTPKFIDETAKRFTEFLDENLEKNPLKSEYLLPTVIRELIDEGKATVEVLKTDATWFGVTYKDDKPYVVKSIKDKVDSGEYPSKLWE